MQPVRAFVAAAALMLALAACAGPRFVKPNTSPEQAASDYDDCSSAAALPDTRDAVIESDILATRGPDWAKDGTLDAHKDVFQADAQQRQSDLIETCMVAKGYSAAK